MKTSKNKYIIVREAADKVEFLQEGGSWSSEYPDAALFSAQDAKRVSRKYGGQVVKNYGLTTEQRV